MIEAHELTRTFVSGKNRVEAVRGIDLKVAEGELVAFLGPNGAGKSTTLRMLTSLLPPTSGRATVAGVDVTTDPAGVRARIGYIGQKHGGGHSYRVWDELVLQGRFYGLDRATAKRRGEELLESLDLGALRMRKISTLSGGQQRRFDIALGLIHAPRLLFLDEPSTGMDPQNRANLWEHILRLRSEQGTTIVLTTHYLEEADSMAERVIVIDHGRLIADDTAGQLKRNLAGDLIELNVAPPDLAATRRVAEELGNEVIDRVVGGDLQVSFRTVGGSAILPEAIRRLGNSGVTVRRATLDEPTLDDVFLNLTGRSLREGQDAA